MIRIITDSSSLYTKEEAEKKGFDSVPLCVSIADIHGRDLQMDSDKYYKLISEGNNPTSSQPPIGDVVEVFEKYPDDEIINISMADGLSGTYQTACSAREIVNNKDNITVINTRTLCGPHRYMVTKAQEMKEKGKSAKEIIDWLNQKIEEHESFLIPQDFDFLKRGGRLASTVATIGAILKLKPIMTQTPDGGKLEKYGIKKTMKSAIKTVIEHMKEKGVDNTYEVQISHARAIDDATFAKAQIENAFEGIDVKIYELSHVFVAQGGPECVAIQYIKK